MRKRQIPGWIGWVGLACYVGAWDLHPDTETMSQAYAPEGTHGRAIYITGWVFITLHLLRVIPNRYDPLRNIPSIRRKEIA